MIGYPERPVGTPARPALAVGHWRVRSVCAAEAQTERGFMHATHTHAQREA